MAMPNVRSLAWTAVCAKCSATNCSCAVRARFGVRCGLSCRDRDRCQRHRRRAGMRPPAAVASFRPPWPAARRRRTRNGAMGAWRWLFGRRLAATLPRGVDRSDRRPDSAAEHPPPPLLRRASAVGCSREISAAALNGRTWPTAANVPSVKQTLWLKSAIRMSVGPLSTQSGLSRVTS